MIPSGVFTGCGCNIYTIKKGRKSRTIYAPYDDFKEELIKINKILQMIPIHPAAHGFVPGRNVVTSAYHHVGFQRTSSYDLKNFFDSITKSHCHGAGLSEEITDLVCVNGAPRQGLPTSPTVSNIVFVWTDYAMTILADRIGGVYTRYADDIAFSHNNTITDSDLTREVREILLHSSFTLNEAKTHHQSAKAGRRRICGVAVDDVSVYPLRSQKRRLRAARHNGNRRHARGLAQWVACPVPKERDQKFTPRLPFAKGGLP